MGFGHSRIRFARDQTYAPGGSPCGLIADRGFASKSSHRKLKSEDIFDGLCARNPKELEGRLKNDEVFAVAQRRRAQSEGRIGILKNNFLEGTPRAKSIFYTCEKRSVDNEQITYIKNRWHYICQRFADRSVS